MMRQDLWILGKETKTQRVLTRSGSRLFDISLISAYLLTGRTVVNVLQIDMNHEIAKPLAHARSGFS